MFQIFIGESGLPECSLPVVLPPNTVSGKITSHHGIHITFDNDVTVSIQWGVGNYCERRWEHDFDAPKRTVESGGVWKSYNTECAIWIDRPTSSMWRYDFDSRKKKKIRGHAWITKQYYVKNIRDDYPDDVIGYCDRWRVQDIINWASSIKPRKPVALLT